MRRSCTHLPNCQLLDRRNDGDHTQTKPISLTRARHDGDTVEMKYIDRDRFYSRRSLFLAGYVPRTIAAQEFPIYLYGDTTNAESLFPNC